MLFQTPDSSHLSGQGSNSIRVTGSGSSTSLPLSIPMPFLFTGMISASLFGVALPWIFPETFTSVEMPHVLALVHIVTLGWLTMVVIGASLQLITVVLASPLHGGRFARWLFPHYVCGVIMLVSGFFWMQPYLLAAGGALVVLAIAHYVFIIGRTIACATSRSITSLFLSASIVYLCIVVSMGLTAAFNFQFHFLGAFFTRLLLIHITLGVAGWLSSTFFGVSYTLIRMFILVQGHDDRLAKKIFILLQGSLVVLVIAFAFSWLPLIIAGGAALVLAIWLFAYDYVRMLRLRRRKVLDISQYHSGVAVLYISCTIPASLLILLSGQGSPQVLAVLGLAVFIGTLGQGTIGYLYKIIPFLVWNTRYGPLVGQQKVPLMRDMINEKLAKITWIVINTGLAWTIVSEVFANKILVQSGSTALGAGLIMAALNIWMALRR